jgi:hypothetical protein
MKKFVCAAFCTFALVGFVTADEFGALITKIDGTTVTYYKTKVPEGAKFGKGEKDGPVQTATVTSKAKIVKAKFDKDAGKLVAGDDWENGLKNDTFAKIDPEAGLNVTLTIEDKGADKGKISQIMAFGAFGKGKGGKGKGKGGN